jgi:hypothetical protein
VHSIPHIERAASRRDFLFRSGGGFGALALAYLLGQDHASAAPTTDNPLAPKLPQFPARAKRVIFLFMEGGPSHLDTFDYKPKLNELAGRSLPASFGKIITAMGEVGSPLLASKRKWAQYGKDGIWISDWLPHIATCADDIAVLRSCWCDGINHSSGVCQMNTCSTIAGRPSLGSWVTYGLGTENQNLPAFVVLADGTGTINGPRNWGAAFMPAVYQGVRLQPGSAPIANLANPRGISDERQRGKLDLLNEMNRAHAVDRPGQTELDARIAAYELAFRMQAHAPEAVDLSAETEETTRLYGMDQPETEVMGRNCLLARRLAESGVRFIQIYHGAGNKWDAHAKIEKNHSELCRSMDKPVAGLLTDLKRRGLLNDTLVIWGGEFGRTPMSEKGDGRDHNPTGFTMWLAGGGVRGGRALGATDDLGLRAVEDRLHIHDLHTTILWLLGLDNMGLVYKYKGRPERPTINEGEAFRRITSA